MRFLFFLDLGSELLSPHRPTLSETTKKPASLAGFSYLRPQLSRHLTLFLGPRSHFPANLTPSVHYSNSKYPLTRLSPTQNCVAAR